MPIHAVWFQVEHGERHRRPLHHRHPRRRDQRPLRKDAGIDGDGRAALCYQIKRERYEAVYRPRTPGSGCGGCALMGTLISYLLSRACRQKSFAYGEWQSLSSVGAETDQGTRCRLKLPQPDPARVRQARGTRRPLLLKHSASSIQRCCVALST